MKTLPLWCAAQKILSSFHLCFHGWNKKQRTTALRVPLKSSGSLVDLYLQNTDSISSVFRWQIRGFICGLAFRLGQNVPHGSLTWSHQSFVGVGTQVSVSFLRFPKHWPGQVSRDICSCDISCWRSIIRGSEVIRPVIYVNTSLFSWGTVL